MTRYVVVGFVVLVALSGCEAIKAVPVYSTVTDPNVSIQDKACSVLNWGLPIVQHRVGALTGTQLAVANGASEAASAYCAGKDLSWQNRAVAAADVLSKVLWDHIK